MTFLTPWRFVFLAAVVVFTVVYILMQRRRKTYALRFSSAELFDNIAPERPSVRRHIPAVLFIVALTTLVTGFAQPARKVKVPRERATVMVVIDVSLSMEADDIEPSRIQAAQTAAVTFIDELPKSLNVGIVAFSGSAAVLVPPTKDRESAKLAVDNLQLSEKTAVGEAIFTSLEALQSAPTDGTGELPPAVIVVLSDGATMAGRSDSAAIEAAKEEDVSVSTISFGTRQGTIIYDDPSTQQVEQNVIPVPVNESSLKEIAKGTDGTFFRAASLEELNKVYDNIGSAIGFETVDREITDWFVGGALMIFTGAAGLSLLWFQRLP